jgi:hypothetical protein
MAKHSTSRPAPAQAHKRRAGSRPPPGTTSTDATDTGLRGGWTPDRTDIERQNEGQRSSIETASRDAEAGGIEAPELLSEVKKASPFE